MAATTRGDLAATREAVADVIRDARADRGRAEAELASLQPARPAAELQAEIDGLLLTPGAKGCTKIGGRVQETVCPKVATLKAEKARSERRTLLETAIVNAARPVSELPAVRDADPLAGAVAVYAQALGWQLDAGKLLPWLSLIPVAFLELGSALAVVVVRHGDVGPATSAAVASIPAVQPNAQIAVLDQSAAQAGPAVRAKPQKPKAKRKDRRPPPSGPASGPPRRGLHAENPSRRLFIPSKRNLLPPGVKGLSYQIEAKTVDRRQGITGTFVKWGSAVDVTAEKAFAALEKQERTSPARDGAAAFMSEVLAGGAKATTEVWEAGEAHGHSRATLRRVVRELGIKSHKDGLGGSWMLSLPERH